MESINLVWDVIFLLLGITAAVFVIVKRNHFDLWLGLLACFAWVLKGIQMLYFDWYVTAFEAMANAGQEMEAIQFVENTIFNLNVVAALVNLLLFSAFVRLVLHGLFRCWYKKALKLMNK